MDEQNVYEAPSSNVINEEDSDKAYRYTGPKSVGVGNGLAWIASGWDIFKQHPGQWILTMVVGFVIMIILGLIPIIGQLFSSITTYVWFGGLLFGCQMVRDGKPFGVEYLFAGFQNRVGSLIGLSFIVFAVALLIMFAVMGQMYFDLVMGNNPEQSYEEIMGMMLSLLIGLAIMIPLIMCVWFAPALIVLQDMDILTAMKESFKGCIKNILPFLVYGVVMFILYIVGVIPLFLGLLVVMPLFFTSMYTSYEDIYLTKNNEQQLPSE